MSDPGKKPATAARAPHTERLQKILSRAGIASRRAAEELIAGGRIEVNGRTVTQPGTCVDPLTDVVTFDGERVRMPPRRVVLVLHKPRGTLCSESDPEGRPLVHHLVPDGLALRTVGRLDFNTEGVLLFTNDGNLAQRLSHPRFGVQRVYEARVRGIPDDETRARLVRGVMLDDGLARVEFAHVVRKTAVNAWLRLALTEGRNREVRRLLERVGHPVMRLRRVRYAGITVEGVDPGKWRELSDREIEELEERGQVGAFELPPDPRARGGRRKGPGVRPPEAEGDEAGAGASRTRVGAGNAAAASRRRPPAAAARRTPAASPRREKAPPKPPARSRDRSSPGRPSDRGGAEAPARPGRSAGGRAPSARPGRGGKGGRSR